MGESVTSTTTVFSDAVKTVFDIVPTVLNTITGNPILATFFVVGIIGIAIGVVRKLKR